ncbi:unnamed protein product [Penicillium glandicola]
MHFSSFLFATLALAATTVWAQDDAPTCLSTCRDDPYTCPGGWVSTELSDEGDDEPCWTCCSQ